MESLLQRIIDEKKELDDRINRLINFLITPEKFNALTPRNQKLLFDQEKAMREYSSILETRIKENTE
jgi:hypothetical protein